MVWSINNGERPRRQGKVRARTVLVTGGSGFLGAHVARLLADRGDFVVLYDVAPPNGELECLLTPVKERWTFVRGQILDLPTLLLAIREHAVRQIVHSAALIDAQFYVRQPFVLFKVNVEGTVNVLEAARLENVERVVYASSIGLIPLKRYEPIDEEHPILDTSGTAPSSPYGASKAAGELFGLSYASHGCAPFIALRFATMYGFGMRQPAYIKPMVENAVRGLPTSFGTGADMLRNYTYIKDCARATLLALDADLDRLEHRVFNACREETVTIGELAQLVKEVIPGAEITVGPGLSEYERVDIRRRGRIDTARARKELGFEARFDLREGIADYVRDYLENVRRTT